MYVYTSPFAPAASGRGEKKLETMHGIPRGLQIMPTLGCAGKWRLFKSIRLRKTVTVTKTAISAELLLD